MVDCSLFFERMKVHIIVQIIICMVLKELKERRMRKWFKFNINRLKWNSQ